MNVGGRSGAGVIVLPKRPAGRWGSLARYSTTPGNPSPLPTSSREKLRVNVACPGLVAGGKRDRRPPGTGTNENRAHLATNKVTAAMTIPRPEVNKGDPGEQIAQRDPLQDPHQPDVRPAIGEASVEDDAQQKQYECSPQDSSVGRAFAFPRQGLALSESRFLCRSLAG